MKKILITLTSFMFVFASATTIKAEDTPNTSGTQHSSANITFVEDEDTTDPIIPDGGGGDNNTDSKGPLSLDVVPSFDFGQGKVQTGHKTFNNKYDISTVQVSDKRDEQGNGWQLTAKMSKLEIADSGHSLPAVINFKNNVVSTTDANEEIGAIAPDNGPMGTAGNTSKNAFELSTGGSEQVIWGASAGKGRSSWASRWIAADASKGNEKVELSVNTNQAKVGTYEATIEWE